MFQFKNRINIIAAVVLAFLTASCSGGDKSITSPSPDNPLFGSSDKSAQIGVSDWFSDGSPSAGMGALGLFNLGIDAKSVSAELIPIRTGALTDVLEIVDITNFLQMAPCMDCAKIGSVSLDVDGNLVVSIGIKHPFPAGDPLKPVSGKNRGDLHVLNIEGTILSNAAVTSFAGMGKSVAGFSLVNADGYSSYLDTVLDEIYPTDATVHPYVLHFDDYTVGNFDASNPMGFESVTDPPPSGNLVMAMGCDYDYQDYVFSIDGTFDFIYAVGCTYAVSSASAGKRFAPEYRIPQHNKKAASEILVEIITNDLAAGDIASTADIEIHVVDVSHGVETGTDLNQMFVDSSVDDIFIDIPGIMTDMLVLDGNNPTSGTGHDPSDPLVYFGTVTNTASGAEGTYHGLVKVTDSYTPGQNQSALLNSMDGIKRVEPLENPLNGLFDIAEFATYQTFSIDVALIITCDLTAPNGGEVWSVGLNEDITWDTGCADNIKIEYSKDGFVSNISEIVASTDDDGVYEWLIPNDPSSTVRVRISDASTLLVIDISDDDFTISGDCTPVFTQKWIYDFPGIERMNGSPAIADLDGDGTYEVLAFTHNLHKLYCFDHEGNFEWTPFTCSSQVASWYGAPAVGEFNGDGVLDIVVSNTNQSSPQHNRIHVIDGATGTEIMNILSPFIFQCMPSLADVVGATNLDPPDGQLDIFVGRYDDPENYTACYNGASGNLVWETRRQGYSMATPALADFNDDGIVEAVSGGGYYDLPPNANGINVLQGVANPTGDRLLWEADYGSNILGAPSLHDYTDDGIPDVIVADYNPPSSTVKCLDGQDGTALWSYSIYHTCMCNPGLGDLNSDGYPDIIIWPPYNQIIALNGDPNASERVLWTFYDPAGSPNLDTRSSPALYDVTCDGVPDVITCMTYNESPTQGIVWIINGATGESITHLDVPGDRIGWGAPAVGDIDNDGIADLVFGSYNNGLLYVYSLGTPVPVDYSARPWPQHMCNIRNTSLYGEEF